MRAAIAQDYGPPEVVSVKDVPAPRPGTKDLLVRVTAAAVTSGDARIRGADFPAGFGVLSRLALGFTRPRNSVLGGAFSGVVTEVGTKTDGFAVGDEVCGMTGVSMGTHAEYVVAPAKKTSHKPPRVSHEDAAGLLFGATAANHFLRVSRTGSDSTVLINGASGAIGTSAIQLAKLRGATVTAVTSTRNAALVRDLGADEVIDYTVAPITASGRRFDVVIDAVGNLDRKSGRDLLSENGILVLGVASLGDNLFARGNVKAGVVPERADDFAHMLSLVADGRLRVVIDESLPLDDIVAAHRRVDSGRKVGNIVITC